MNRNIMKLGVAAIAMLILVGCVAKDDGYYFPRASSRPDNSELVVTDEVTVENIHAAVKKELGTKYIPNSDERDYFLKSEMGQGADLVEDASVEMFFYQESEEELQAYVKEHGDLPPFYPDRFVAIKAKNGGANKVKLGLEESIKQALPGAESLYPNKVSTLTNSQIVIHGDYVFLVALGSIEDSKLATDTIDSFFD